MEHHVVTKMRAAELIGGIGEGGKPAPVSRDTIDRMVAAGILEQRGRGQLARITLASITAYLEGRGEPCQATATDRTTRTSTASGGRSFPSATGATDASAVLIVRKPRPR
jgi:hypothetical protein